MKPSSLTLAAAHLKKGQTFLQFLTWFHWKFSQETGILSMLAGPFPPVCFVSVINGQETGNWNKPVSSTTRPIRRISFTSSSNLEPLEKSGLLHLDGWCDVHIRGQVSIQMYSYWFIRFIYVISYTYIYIVYMCACVRVSIMCVWLCVCVFASM